MYVESIKWMRASASPAAVHPLLTTSTTQQPQTPNSFVLSLLTEERLLDELLIEQQAAFTATGGDGGDETAQVEKGLALVHDVYGAFLSLFLGFSPLSRGGARMTTTIHNHPHTHLSTHHPKTADVYQDFHARWVAADPPNVLSFPLVFEEVKAAARRRLRRARGDWSVWAFLP